MRSRFAALLTCFLIAAMYTLAAQAQPAPEGSPGASECRPGSNAPTLGEQDSTRSLSERLAQSKGVICPPHDVDPQIHAEPPPQSGGKMPIIPPPGGDNPNVQPR